MPTQVQVRAYPGLPQVARARLFSRAPAPAVLLVPDERLPLYRGLEAFGVRAYPEPSPYAAKEAAHLVIGHRAALAPVPADPWAEGLVLTAGKSYPRSALLAALEALGHTRETDVRVLGEVVEVGEHRLEFFGETLERIERAGEEVPAFRIEPRSGRAAGPTVPLLALTRGPVWVEQPGRLSEAAWGLVGDRLAAVFAPWDGAEPVPPGVRPLAPYRAELRRFRKDLTNWLANGLRVVLFYKHEKGRAYLTQRLLADLPTRVRPTVEPFPGVLLVPAGFEGGFLDPEEGVVYLSEALLFGFAGASAVRRTFLRGEGVADPELLSVGDYLIHPEHGIGRYLGLETREVLGVRRDYLVLQYRDAGRLYVPVEDLPTLRRHPATSDEPPELSSLAKKDWKRAKEKARRSAEALAQRLLVLYARRRQEKGTAFPPLPDWDPLIEQNFPFELTADQKQALEDVFRDLEAERPMDRLISGDVGFGKTEVALRAAHRVVGHGHQVAFLVPTTLLAEQHHRTFAERYRDLPVRVAMLSRFTPEREARRVLEDLAAGRVDIVIGTHRLLEPGVRFRRLGLLIVDEEHRFGVGQKERLKELRAGVDVLMLSATPIPRTLYQALVGLKDISAIQTPPPGRKPIRTVVAPFDPLLVREAVLREMDRGGRVFFVHDRVASIERRARWLERLVPEARIGVVHGQMSAAGIEEVMLAFAHGAYDVLVATTIIESGLDVPLADTIVIERADRLGLAQLYQLRGRVGRRRRAAWAYLLHPPRLTEAAEKRLAAIADLSDLGSGHLLAERDMEIRGVGNLLGPEQHGHVRAVSLEVYAEMVAEAVRRLRGEEAPARPRLTLDLKVSARIPPDYLPDLAERSRVYAALARARGLAEVGRVRRRLAAERGPLPEEAENFFRLTKIRLLAERRGLLSITEDLAQIQLVAPAYPPAHDPHRLAELPFPVELTRYPPGFRIPKARLGQPVIEAVERLLSAL